METATITNGAPAAPAAQVAKPGLTFEQKVELFKATAHDLQARQDFAASRAEVILPLLQQQSTIRAIFQEERLAPGASARYDIPFDDIDCVWMMPGIGQVPTVQLEGTELYVDTFGLDGGVEWQMDIATDGRFQVATLATQMLKNKFIKQEEYAGWNLIKTHEASLVANGSTQIIQGRDDNNTTSGTKKLNLYTINEVLTVADEMGVGGRRVTDMYLSPRRFADLRAYITQLGVPENLRQNIWNNGQIADTIADIRFHRVYDRNLVPDNKAYAFTQKEGFKYGVLPVREELKTVNNPMSQNEWKIGIMGRERLGFGILDDKGLLVIDF
jgi:hypothetical protein